MTREEAIANLNMISVAFVEPVTKEQRKLIDDTFDTAIKALEQEPKIVPIAEIKFDDDMLHEIVEETVKNIEIEIEPKTGHWRHYEGMLICSECGTEFYDDIMEYCGDDVPKCCPNCGCRMFEPQESEE